MLTKSTAEPPNAFIGKSEPPSDDELTAQLGPARALWDRLVRELAQEHPAMTAEWHSYSIKAGWAIRLKLEKRTILYISPFGKAFRVSFALSERAVKSIKAGGFPARLLELLNQASRYAEGTALRIPITGPADIAVIKRLAAVKIEN